MTAFEHVVEERFRFDVSLRVPLVGLLGAPRTMEVTARAPVESFG